MQDGQFHIDQEDPKPKKKAVPVKDFGQKVTLKTPPKKQAAPVSDWGDDDVVVADMPLKKKQASETGSNQLSVESDVSRESKPNILPIQPPNQNSDLIPTAAERAPWWQTTTKSAIPKPEKTPDEKLKALGLNVTFKKPEPFVSIEQPEKRVGQVGVESTLGITSQPEFVDLNNIDQVASLTDRVEKSINNQFGGRIRITDLADKYNGKLGDVFVEKHKDVADQLKYRKELLDELSVVAAKNAANEVLKLKDQGTPIQRDDLLKVGQLYTKQISPAYNRRNESIIKGGEDLGDENKYNLEKIGASVLMQNVTEDRKEQVAAVNNETDIAHPKYATAKGWDIIGAYNHLKDNKANNGWWRTRPSLGQVQRWLEEPELKEMFVGNEVAYDEIKKTVQSGIDKLTDAGISAADAKATDVPVGGFLNRATQAFGGGLESIGNIFDSDAERQKSNLNPTLKRGSLTGNYSLPGQSPAILQQKNALEDKQKQEGLTPDEQKEYNALVKTTEVRDGWDKFLDASGDVTGQVVLQALLTKGVGLGTGAVTNVAKVPMLVNAGIPAALISYDPVKKQAVYNFPDDQAKQNIYTGTMVLANVLSERIFQDEKVFKAFSNELKGDVTGMLKKLSAKEISKADIKNLVADKLLKYGKNMVKEGNKESLEEAIVQVVDEAAQYTLGAEDYKGENAIKNIGDTYLTTLLSIIPVSALAARSNIKADDFNSVGLYKMALNPDTYKDKVEQMYKDGDLTNDEKNEKIKILNTASLIAASEPPKIAQKNTKERAEYLVQTLNGRLKSGELENIQDKNQAAEVKEEIKKSEKRAAEIYNSQSELTTDEKELLTQLQEKAGGEAKKENLQYFIDKAAEDPAAFMEIHDKKTTNQLLEKVPVEKLKENRDYLIENFGESESTDYLNDIINSREKAATSQPKAETEIAKEKVDLSKPVYHGTFGVFDEFDEGSKGSNTGANSAKEGFFFATNKKVAEGYSGSIESQRNDMRKRADEARKQIEELTGESEHEAASKMAREALHGYETGYSPEVKKKVSKALKRISDYDSFEESISDEMFAPENKPSKKGTVKEVYLDIKNPFVFDAEEQSTAEIGITEIIKKAKADGHDGVVIKNTYDGKNPTANELTDVHVVFSKDQIKNSAAAKEAAPPTPISTEGGKEIAPRIVEPITNKKKIGEHFSNVVKGLDRDEIDQILSDWGDGAQLNEDGTGIKVSGAFRRNAVSGEGSSYKGSKAEFINWLNSDAPFDEKVYGKDIRNNEEYTNLINKAREAAGFESDKSATPVTVGEKPGKKEAIKQKLSTIEDLQEPRDKVLKYFGNGGKIHPSAITELYGGKDPRLHTKTSPEGERKARIGLLSNSAPNIERLAETFLEDNPNERYKLDEFRNAIEDVLQDHVSGGSAARELIDKYITQSVKQDLTEAEAKQMDDAAIAKRTKIVQSLPENQQADLLQLIEKYEDKYGNVDWEKLEKDSNGFEPNILSLPIETQKALDGIIQKNISEAASESNNTTDKNGISGQKEKTSSQEVIDEAATIPKNIEGTEQVPTEKTIGEKELASEPTQTTGEGKKTFSNKARELAAKIREQGLNAALPDWAKADLPEGTTQAGFGGKSLDNAIAKAIELVADAVDAGKELADAIKEGYAHLKDHYSQNTKSFDEEKVRGEFERNMNNIFSEQDASGENQSKQKEDQPEEQDTDIDKYEMTTSGEVNRFLSGETLQDVFGEAPEGEQQYEVQKLSDMLQDGKNMINIATAKWGNDVMDYGKPLFEYIQNMSNDNQLTNKKAVLMATFLGELKESMLREPDRRGEIQPLYNTVEAYYQQYMNLRGKEVVAGRLLRLYRDKYVGDLFVDRILEEEQVKAKKKINEIEQKKKIDDETAQQADTVTKETKDADDQAATKKVSKAKEKQGKKKNLSTDDAKNAAAAKLEEIKNRVGDKSALIQKINDAINRLNCK